MTLQELLDKIKRDSGITDPVQIALIARTATRAVELGSRAALGENVDEELAIVKATALNIEERGRNAIGLHLPAFLTETITAFLTRLLTA